MYPSCALLFLSLHPPPSPLPPPPLPSSLPPISPFLLRPRVTHPHRHLWLPSTRDSGERERERKKAEDVEVTRNGRTRSTCTLIRTLIVKVYLTVFFFPYFLSFFRLSKCHRCHGVNCRHLKSKPYHLLSIPYFRLPVSPTARLDQFAQWFRIALTETTIFLDWFLRVSTTRERASLTLHITHRKYATRRPRCRFRIRIFVYDDLRAQTSVRGRDDRRRCGPKDNSIPQKSLYRFEALW